MGRISSTVEIKFKSQKFSSKSVDYTDVLNSLKDAATNIEDLGKQDSKFWKSLYAAAKNDTELSSFIDIAAKNGLSPFDCVRQAVKQHCTRKIHSASRDENHDYSSAVHVRNDLVEVVNTDKLEKHHHHRQHHHHHHHDHLVTNRLEDVRNVHYLQDIQHVHHQHHYPQTTSHENNVVRTVRESYQVLPTISTVSEAHDAPHRPVKIAPCSSCYETGVTTGLKIPAAEQAAAVVAQRYADMGTTVQAVVDRVRNYVAKGQNDKAAKLAEYFNIKGKDSGYDFEIPANAPVIVHDYQCAPRIINRKEKVIRNHDRSASEDHDYEVHVHNVNSNTIETRPLLVINEADHHHHQHHHRLDKVIYNHNHHIDVPVTIQNVNRHHTHHKAHNYHKDEYVNTSTNATAQIQTVANHAFEDPIVRPHEFVPDCPNGKCNDKYYSKQAMNIISGPILDEVTRVVPVIAGNSGYLNILTNWANVNRIPLDLMGNIPAQIATVVGNNPAIFDLFAGPNGLIGQLAQDPNFVATARTAAPIHVRYLTLRGQGLTANQALTTLTRELNAAQPSAPISSCRYYSKQAMNIIAGPILDEVTRVVPVIAGNSSYLMTLVNWARMNNIPLNLSGNIPAQVATVVGNDPAKFDLFAGPNGLIGQLAANNDFAVTAQTAAPIHVRYLTLRGQGFTPEQALATITRELTQNPTQLQTRMFR